MFSKKSSEASSETIHDCRHLLQVIRLGAICFAITKCFVAKHKRRRRNFNGYTKGNLDIDQSLGTLASKTAVLAATDTVIDRTLVSSVKATYTLSNLAEAANAGPIEVGVAHGDYTLAEIEAYLELATSWKETDLLDKEIQSRRIRRIGVFDSPAAATAGTGAYTLNDGKAIRTKLNWILTNGQGLNYWIYNLGTAALATSDPNVNIRGHANLWAK